MSKVKNVKSESKKSKKSKKSKSADAGAAVEKKAPKMIWRDAMRNRQMTQAHFINVALVDAIEASKEKRACSTADVRENVIFAIANDEIATKLFASIYDSENSDDVQFARRLSSRIYNHLKSLVRESMIEMKDGAWRLLAKFEEQIDGRTDAFAPVVVKTK